jgi:hypothetical protein
VRARPARADAFLWPQRVPRDIGHLPLAGQASGERVTATRCGRLTGQDAVVSLMRGDRLMPGARLNGGADLS